MERFDNNVLELQIDKANELLILKLNEIPLELPIEFQFKLAIVYNNGQDQITSGLYKWTIE